MLAGLAAGAVTAGLGSRAFAPLVGWDVAAATFIIWIWVTTIALMSPAETAAHATRQDPGKAASDVVVLIAAVASLAAVGVVLVQATAAKGIAQDLLAGFGVASVALSWFAIHTLFTLRYAQLYYSAPTGGIDFNQEGPPRYLDFAYVAFSVGMTFQISDTDLQTTQIRATALRHGLLSFLFGSFILATTINLIASLGSGSPGGG